MNRSVGLTILTIPAGFKPGLTSSVSLAASRVHRTVGFDQPRVAGQHERYGISMSIIAWIVVGAIAGFLASQVMNAREGLFMMVVLGIVGGLLGGFVATSVLKMGSVNGINIESIVIATLGAIAVVFIASFVTGSRKLGRR